MMYTTVYDFDQDIDIDEGPDYAVRDVYLAAVHDDPKPGSNEAIEQGCTCPWLDNRRGAGIAFYDPRPVYLVTSGCPIHDAEEECE